MWVSAASAIGGITAGAARAARAEARLTIFGGSRIFAPRHKPSHDFFTPIDQNACVLNELKGIQCVASEARLGLARLGYDSGPATMPEYTECR